MTNGDGKGHEAMQKEQPPLIIVDMESRGNVTELIGQIRRTVPRAKILLVAGWNDMERTRQASS